jgi:hypothetical protein
VYGSTLGWFVTLQTDVDKAAVIAALQLKYRFSAQPNPPIGSFFVQSLSAAQLTGFRCEPAIRVVEQNSGSYPIP